MLDAAGEVVAGAERQQAEHRVVELLAAVQRGDDRVQAAVAARDHDPARPGAVQDAVELARAWTVAHTSTEARARSTASAAARFSSSAVPASAFVITRSGPRGGPYPSVRNLGHPLVA